MSAISLEVKPTPGSHINDVFADGLELAQFLKLGWVDFEFNDLHCTVYPDGRGFAYNRGAHLVGTFTPAAGYVEKGAGK